MSAGVSGWLHAFSLYSGQQTHTSTYHRVMHQQLHGGVLMLKYISALNILTHVIFLPPFNVYIENRQKNEIERFKVLHRITLFDIRIPAART